MKVQSINLYILHVYIPLNDMIFQTHKSKEANKIYTYVFQKIKGQQSIYKKILRTYNC